VKGVPATVIAEHLAAYLGPATAVEAVATLSRWTLHKQPADLAPGDLPALLDAVGTLLRPLLGAARTSEVLCELEALLR
jgi:hypothetical protein